MMYDLMKVSQSDEWKNWALIFPNAGYITPKGLYDILKNESSDKIVYIWLLPEDWQNPDRIASFMGNLH